MPRSAQMVKSGVLEEAKTGHTSTTAQKKPSDSLQSVQTVAAAQLAPKRESSPNLTGIPTQLKESFEERSGLSFDDVRVHYNSDKPAQLAALAYTQGNQVHIGPGQEKHLPHELGHVVQQKEGRVRPTVQMHGMNVNDDATLEREANSQNHFNYSKTNYEKNFQAYSSLIQLQPKEYLHIITDAKEKNIKAINTSGLKCLVSQAKSEGKQWDDVFEEKYSGKPSNAYTKLEHKDYVFMWDDSKEGIDNAERLVKDTNGITIRIRKNLYSIFNSLFNNFKEDNKGSGAWMYKGDIERKFLFIDKIDNRYDVGYDQWVGGNGWPVNTNFEYRFSRSIGEIEDELTPLIKPTFAGR